MNSKNAMICEHDMNCQCVYELEAELKELKSNFASFSEWCQLPKSSRDAKEHELTDIVSKVPAKDIIRMQWLGVIARFGDK